MTVKTSQVDSLTSLTVSRESRKKFESPTTFSFRPDLISDDDEEEVEDDDEEKVEDEVGKKNFRLAHKFTENNSRFQRKLPKMSSKTR